MGQRYNLKNIRTLLIAGFSAEQLRRFCHDTLAFKSVYDQFAQDTGKATIIDRLIEYTKQQLLFEQLLDWIKTENPARYE